MQKIFFLLLALGFMHNDAIGGLGAPSKNRVPIDAGQHRLPDGRVIQLAEPVDLAFDPPPPKTIADEPYVLKTEQPDRWLRGTQLRSAVAGGTPLPACLEPGSVVVKLADGTVAEPGKDYVIDEHWSSLGRVEGGRIAPDAEVKISYRLRQMRIDTIEVDPSGKVAVRQGTPAVTCPLPPPRTPGSTAWANVFMPYDATADVKPWQIFEIGPPFPEPDEAEMQRRSKFVEKTLGKLRRGEPVTVVTWGDSVTAGGDASTPDKAFAPLFCTRLGERFPKSKVTHVNAGIGGSSTLGRLAAIQAEVLAHKPDLVTIEFINDMGLPEERVRENYRSAFEQIRAAGAEIILITPHFSMPPWMGHPHSRGKETRATVELLRAIAAEHNVGLADTSRRWEHLETEGLPYVTLLVNGINHPDDRGHELFVKDLMSFFPVGEGK
jgi:lysophospholipase L1-like esterase